jgi:2-iminobutanoate/2-iminopropanoate deaminase
MIERLNPPGVPAPRGPYSPAIRAGDLLFISGQVPVNPETQQVELSDIAGETRLVLSNIKRLLDAAGADFAAMNQVYSEFFGDAKPTRTTVACEFVMPGIKVEIDCVAYVGEK